MNVLDMIDEHAEGAKYLTDDMFHDCIIAITNSCEPNIVYDSKKIIEALMSGDDGLSYEDAIEHFEFNILGSYVGERTPIFVNMIGDIDG